MALISISKYLKNYKITAGVSVFLVTQLLTFSTERLFAAPLDISEPIANGDVDGSIFKNIKGTQSEAVYIRIEKNNGADAYTSFQKALDAGAGKTVRVSAGIYTFAGGTPIVRSGTTVFCAVGAVLLQPNVGKFAALAVQPGSVKVTIQGCDLRGPWYGTGVPAWDGGVADSSIWGAQYAENIGIDVRGRWYQRQVLAYSLKTMQALSTESVSINLIGNRIEGFGQSCVLADQITDFKADENILKNCGRDGLRMYGVQRGRVSRNHIDNISPGFGGKPPFYNAYGITATRLYGNSKYPDPLKTMGRVSREITISNNDVERVDTWKSLDTHGGVRIEFTDNRVKNSYIGIGVDKGGFSEDHGKAPPLNILISGNTVDSIGNRLDGRRAGIALYGHSAGVNTGNFATVSKNMIIGYGGDSTDGAISVSNFQNIEIVNNMLINSRRAGVTLAGEVRNFTISGNSIEGVEKTNFKDAYGVFIQTAKASGLVNSNVFRADVGDMSYGIFLSNSSPGYEVRIGTENQFQGTRAVKHVR